MNFSLTIPEIHNSLKQLHIYMQQIFLQKRLLELMLLLALLQIWQLDLPKHQMVYIMMALIIAVFMLLGAQTPPLWQ